MLIYCSFPILGRKEKPTWVDSFKESLYVKSQGWVVYDPWLKVSDQPGLLKAISEQKVNKIAEEQHALLKLNSLMLENTPESVEEFLRCDAHELSSQVIFKDLFLLIRSNLVIVDCNNPSTGAGQEVLYAHLMDIPILGISYRNTVSPWSQNRVLAMAAPKNADDLVRLVLGTLFKGE